MPRRRFHNLLTAASLLACLATAALWHRSARTDDLWLRHGAVEAPGPGLPSHPMHGIESNRGVLSVFRTSSLADFSDQPRGWHHYTLHPQHWEIGGPADPRSRGGFWNQLGFSFGGAGTMWFFTVPHWLIVIATGALPAVRGWREATRRWRQWREGRLCHRLARGLCLRCGYDLRATPDRCPECGTAVPKLAAGGRGEASHAGASV